MEQASTHAFLFLTAKIHLVTEVFFSEWNVRTAIREDAKVPEGEDSKGSNH